LRASCADAQLLALVDHDCLADRLVAAKIGSDRCIAKSTAIAEVLDTIIKCMARPQTLSARLLAVDDDADVLAALVHLLEPWGIQVTGLSDPSQFWDFLTAINPDAVLLDLEMPELKGIELCQVVRQDARYSDLPILMVTAHTDSASLQEVFAVGADDLISKPIVGPELVNRVLSRLERNRLRHRLNHLQQQSQKWQQFVNLDPITQISNRHAFEYFLSQGWQQALQQQQPLSLIFCHVDYFDRYCSRYGTQMGNDCLRSIAHTIQRCIKPFEDQVAKVEAEKFAITLPNTSLTGALQVAERIQRAIAALTILHQDSPISAQVTLSLGITGTHPTGEKTIDTLIETAHQELALANERGGNTFCLSPY
jgi:diguanylate cyclase (GGDEF)-like protein